LQTNLKGLEKMSRKKYSPEQVIIYLREVEVLLSQGNTIAEAARQIEVTE